MEKLIGRNEAEVGVQDALSDLLLMSLVRRLGLILGGDAIGDMFSVHACFAVVLRLKRRARAISDPDCLFRRAHFFSVLGRGLLFHPSWAALSRWPPGEACSQSSGAKLVL